MTASNISGGSVVWGAKDCPRRPTLFTKPEKQNCHGRGIENFCRFLHTSGQLFSYRTPINGPLPPRTHITGRVVNTVTRGWVGAANERVPTQSLVLSIDICRGLGISSRRIQYLAEVFSGRSWPNICPGVITSIFSSKV